MPEQQIDHAFYEQVLRDNEKLRELLGQVTREFAGGAANAGQVAQLLNSLASQLETHFIEEEQAGVFSGVVERAPHLSERVEQLRQQHDEMRAAFASIKQAANSGDGTAQWWSGLSKAFHEFSTNLMHHEALENQIVQEAYTQDIGSKD